MTSRRKQKNGQNKIIIAILSLLIVAAVAVCTVTVTALAGHFSAPDTQPSASSTQSTASEPQPVVKTSTATIAATGDLLMHEPIIKNAV